MKQYGVFKTILIPLDGSQLAEAALDHGETLARKFNSRLILLRVCTAAAQVDPVSGLDSRQVYLDQLAKVLREASLEVETRLHKGDPGKVIIEIAESSEIDLVILSSHGRTGLARWVYGSVAEKILHEARCPMMLIRAQS
jgi:nucleotide-binding universal stress UspA family protein